MQKNPLQERSFPQMATQWGRRRGWCGGNPKGSTGVLWFFSVGFMWLGALFKFALGIFFFWMPSMKLLSIGKRLWEKLVYCTEWCVLNYPVFVYKHCKCLLKYKEKKKDIKFFIFLLLLPLEELKELFSCTSLKESMCPNESKMWAVARYSTYCTCS